MVRVRAVGAAWLQAEGAGAGRPTAVGQEITVRPLRARGGVDMCGRLDVRLRAGDASTGRRCGW